MNIFSFTAIAVPGASVHFTTSAVSQKFLLELVAPSEDPKKVASSHFLGQLRLRGGQMMYETRFVRQQKKRRGSKNSGVTTLTHFSQRNVSSSFDGPATNCELLELSFDAGVQSQGSKRCAMCVCFVI